MRKIFFLILIHVALFSASLCGTVLLLNLLAHPAHAQAAPEPQQIEEMERQEGHAQHHDVYKNWKRPENKNLSCCNERKVGPNGDVQGDCYPTEAMLAPPGDQNVGVDHDVWWALRYDGRWIEIPEERIIREHNPDETGSRAHLCQADYSMFVLCFVPPTGTF
jgi:hypothetical protein